MPIARRTFLASAAAMVGAPAVARLARADPAIALKLHHSFSSVSSVHDKFLVPWARKVEAESSGRIRIDLFPSMELGGAPAQLFDQARDGTADLAWTAPSLTPGRFPKIELFELPFVPARRALVSSKALQDFAGANLKDEFREVRPICFSCSDRAVIHGNQAVHRVEDIKDVRFYVPTRLAGEAMRVLGADPVPMPSAQLPSAIAQHVVDGCIEPWHMVPPLRLNDLLKTHTEFSDLSLSSRTYVLAMNSAAYERLPRELKAVIDNNSGQFAAGLAGAMWDLQAAAVANMVVERGDVIVTLLPEAVAHWRKATEPVIEAWQRELKQQKVDGGKLLAAARLLLAKYANEPEPQPPSAVPEQEVATQPQQVPQAKADVAATPADAAAPGRTSPVAKPVASPAATPAPSLAPPPHVAAPAASPATTMPHAAAAAQAPNSAPTLAMPAPATASAAPVVPPSTPAPTAAIAAPAPAASPAPPRLPKLPPKTLDIPL